MINQFNNK